VTADRFDPTEFKQQQRATWNLVSAGCAAWRKEFERGAASVTTWLLELGGVRPGQAVLDVATGQGEPAISAARVVGPSGRVVGIDLSPAMLEVARRNAAGLDNVEFIEADMDSLDGVAAEAGVAGPFDVVLSRFGLMFSADHVATFRGLARVLVPGGVLAAAVWGPPDTHPLSAGPVVLGERLGLPSPPPGTPGPFSMSDPRQLTEELTAAGLTDASVVEQVVPFRFDSVDDYVRFNREVLPPPMLQMVRDRFGSEDAPAAWDAIAQAVEQYVDQDGTLPLPSTALCLRAVRP
jgi:SAM-dependent methyltransferase